MIGFYSIKKQQSLIKPSLDSYDKGVDGLAGRHADTMTRELELPLGDHLRANSVLYSKLTFICKIE